MLTQEHSEERVELNRGPHAGMGHLDYNIILFTFMFDTFLSVSTVPI